MVRLFKVAVAAVVGSLAFVILVRAENDARPGPNAADRAFATQLWQALAMARMVGADAIRTAPFKGGGTHTEVLEYLEQNVRVGYLNSLAIVKRNYTNQNGKTVSLANVWKDPAPYLMSVTVMFRRPGFDRSRKDWFYAEYEPNGKVTYAGKVEHCIGCHQAAEGGDFRFLPVAE